MKAKVLIDGVEVQEPNGIKGLTQEIIAGVILNRWYLHLPVSKELVDWAWEEIRGTQSYTEYAEQFKQRIPEELLCEHTKK